MKFTLRSIVTRAARTAAQTLIAAIGTTAAIEAVDWKLAASTAGLATLLSVLTSIATGLPEDADTPQGLNHP